MTARSFGLFAAVLAGLAGCPAPVEEAATVPGPPGGEIAPPPGDAPPPPPGDPSAPPQPTDGAPVAGPTMIGLSAESGSFVNPEDLKFARFITPDQKTVTLTITVEGATAGQVDVTSLVEKDGTTAPTVLHVESFTGGNPVVITAPANYADALYISAMVKVDKGGKDEPPPSGPPTLDPKQISGVTEPVRLEAKDLAVTVKMGSIPPWLDKLAGQARMPTPPKDGQAPVGPPPGVGTPALPPAGAPGTPPPPAPNPTK
jgi:hypothetical protein